MTDQAEPAPRPSRRFPRFSVRGLIIVVLVIGAALGSLVRIARIQRDAVATIANGGGLVKFDWAWNGNEIPGGRPPAPRWLVNLIGVDYFGHVTYVGLGEASDAAFTQVGRLNLVHDLFFSSGPEFSDDWLVHLNGLTSLSYLDMSANPVTDHGLIHLRGRSNLSILDLNHTRITDAGLVQLTGLSKLSQLELANTKVSDVGLVQLEKMTSISSLNLDHTRITDAGLVHLTALSKLSQLNLANTKVSDAGLVHLGTMKNLVDLTLSRSQVTDAGRKELQQALPSLRIYR